jgi:energy-coupling factor transporter transmembrane protein EcfT
MKQVMESKVPEGKPTLEDYLLAALIILLVVMLAALVYFNLR